MNERKPEEKKKKIMELRTDETKQISKPSKLKQIMCQPWNLAKLEMPKNKVPFVFYRLNVSLFAIFFLHVFHANKKKKKRRRTEQTRSTYERTFLYCL